MPNVYPDAYHITQPTTLTSTTQTTCYTVPTKKWAFVQELFACDKAGIERLLTVKYVKSGTEYVVKYQGKVCAKEGMRLTWEGLHLAAGDTIKCTANIGVNYLDVTINALEIAQPRI